MYMRNMYGYICIVCGYDDIINKEVVMQVIAEPISAPAKEEVYYSLLYHHYTMVLLYKVYIICVGCVGTRLG